MPGFAGDRAAETVAPAISVEPIQDAPRRCVQVEGVTALVVAIPRPSSEIAVIAGAVDVAPVEILLRGVGAKPADDAYRDAIPRGGQLHGAVCVRGSSLDGSPIDRDDLDFERVPSDVPLIPPTLAVDPGVARLTDVFGLKLGDVLFVEVPGLPVRSRAAAPASTQQEREQSGKTRERDDSIPIPIHEFLPSFFELSFRSTRRTTFAQTTKSKDRSTTFCAIFLPQEARLARLTAPPSFIDCAACASCAGGVRLKAKKNRRGPVWRATVPQGFLGKQR